MKYRITLFSPHKIPFPSHFLVDGSFNSVFTGIHLRSDKHHGSRRAGWCCCVTYKNGNITLRLERRTRDRKVASSNPGAP